MDTATHQKGDAIVMVCEEKGERRVKPRIKYRVSELGNFVGQSRCTLNSYSTMPCDGDLHKSRSVSFHRSLDRIQRHQRPRMNTAGATFARVSITADNGCLRWEGCY